MQEGPFDWQTWARRIEDKIDALSVHEHDEYVTRDEVSDHPKRREVYTVLGLLVGGGLITGLVQLLG